MSNSGKEGERLFSELMQSKGYIVNDVSKDQFYFDKDIDLFIINPNTKEVKSFEVKWDTKIHKTSNLFLEIYNPRSKQWSGEGWWKHCQADYLVYGDAVKRKFYIIPLLELRERVSQLLLTTRTTSDYSTGIILPLAKIRDIIVEEDALCQKQQ